MTMTCEEMFGGQETSGGNRMDHGEALAQIHFSSQSKVSVQNSSATLRVI